MNDPKHTIGKAISKLRLDLGLSQEALAERAAIHRTYVSQIERGVKSPTVSILIKIAKALETKPSCLLRMIEDKFD